MPPANAEPVDVTVVVPTYNRANVLTRLLDSLAAQEADGVAFEVLVVDNDSTDDTREAVERCVGHYPELCVRYLFEPRKGVSYARNTGIAHARGAIIAFIDDDVEAKTDWVAALKRAFDVHPTVHAIGGRVRPRWVTPPPAWLTSRHHGAIAVQDRRESMVVDRANAAACLITANFACRAVACRAVGGFSPDYPRCQDREFQMRLWRAGFTGLYLPSIEVSVSVPPERCTKTYHRRWQRTTGKYHAKMRYRDSIDHWGAMVEHSHRTVLGTPLFIWRAAFAEAVRFVAALVAGHVRTRFDHEAWLWYYSAYIAHRAAAPVAERRSKSAATTRTGRSRTQSLLPLFRYDGD